MSPEQYSNIRFCSNHFLSNAPSKLYDVNNAPSLQLGYTKGGANSESSSKRYGIALKRRRLCLQKEAESRITEDMQQDEYLNNEQLDSDLFEEESGIALQTDILSEDLDTATVALQQQVNKVKKERDTLRKRMLY